MARDLAPGSVSSAHGKRPVLALSRAVTLTAVALALAGCGATRHAAANFCTSIGLTAASASKAFGQAVIVTRRPNNGGDIGDCLIARPGVKFVNSYRPFAFIELFSTNTIGQYESQSSVTTRLTGLGKGAVLVTGPKSLGYPGVGPDVFFTGGHDFVAITANPTDLPEPAVKPAQVIRLAREINRKVG